MLSNERRGEGRGGGGGQIVVWREWGRGGGTREGNGKGGGGGVKYGGRLKY